MKKTTLALGFLLVLWPLASGCKKKSRKELCEEGQSSFNSGMASALEAKTAGMNAEQKKFVDDKLALAKKNFMGFCMALTDAEIKCLSNQDTTSSSCAHVMGLVQTKLLEM
jgi:hypothetical protein